MFSEEKTAPEVQRVRIPQQCLAADLGSLNKEHVSQTVTWALRKPAVLFHGSRQRPSGLATSPSHRLRDARSGCLQKKEKGSGWKGSEKEQQGDSAGLSPWGPAQTPAAR